MKSHPYTKPAFILLSLALILAGVARADFNPIALNPASFNHDVVVEATAPRSLSDAVNATMDGGTNKNGNTWFEVGYFPGRTNGLPAQNSLVSNATADRTWRMAPDYHVNNVIMVGHAGGGQTPVVTSGTLTLTTPAAYSALSILTSSGNGPVSVGYVIHYADSTTESNTFSSVDWFNATPPLPLVFNAAGRLSVSGGGLQNIDATPAGRAYQTDLALLATPAVNVTSIDFYYVGSGANGNTNNNGRAAIFAIAGSTDNVTFNPIAVTGFNYDMVVEADGPQTTGTGLASSGAPTNNITATMDGGKSKTSNVWYERGYYAALPNTGIPIAGSSLTSAVLPSISYTMPPSYVGNCAVLLSSNETTANISFASPAPYRALSFLCGAANGDTIVPCILSFSDGTTETNAILIRDWFTRTVQSAFLSFGRVLPLNRSLNSTPDQFVNPYVTTPPGPFSFDYRNLGLPVPRLFDSILYVTNSVGAITNIALSFTNGVTSTRVTSIFAVSGTASDAVPPLFGVAGSAATGQPGVMNNITLVKRWEGTNNVLLTSSLSAGTPPVSYQWMRAPRGGGLRDIFYTFDYSTFANLVDGGRISGATSNNLVINNALSADSFDYLVIASNAYGMATSSVATVMIVTTNQSVLLGAPAGDTIAGYTGDGAPGAESVDHVGDRVAQKWLSFGQNNQVLPFTGPVGYVVTPVSGASIVSSMRFYPANDTQGRDPFDYALEGSNDGASWTPITGGFLRGTLSLPTVRNTTGAAALTPLAAVPGPSVTNVVEVNFANATGYKSYRVTITNTIDRYRQSLMQITEIDLLGTFVPAPPVWVRQPEPAVTVYVGSSPTFTAVASGIGALAPRYQWYKNGSTLIAGATSSSYTLPNAQLVDSGTTFSCTASNSSGPTTITSSSATLTVIAAPTQSYPATVLADNALGYWRLNEGPDNGSGNNGVVAHDYRGGRNGSFSNVTLQVDGYNPASDPDKAGDFGTVATLNSYVSDIKDVDFARAANTPGAVFSLEAWVYGGSQAANAGIVAKGYNGILAAGTGTGTEQFALDVIGATATTRTFRFLVRDATGNGTVALSSAIPYDPIALVPTWHHLVGVCDQPNGKIYLYVDGLLTATGNLAANAGILAQPLPMTIGARKSTGSSEYDNQWQGRIDDVAIYNSALSASQALGHFYAGQRPPVITLQPTNATTAENVSVTFSSSAYGPPTQGFQWYLSDGVNPTNAIAGQTSSNLTFTTAAAQNGNFYQVVVTNNYGSSTSTVAQLTVVSGPPSFFVDLPASSTFFVGHVIQLRVVAGGTAPFTYQWQKNSVNIVNNYRTSGAQSDTLTIAYANFADSGNYQVLVTGLGTTPSALDAVTVTNATPPAPFTAAGTGWSLQGTLAPPIMTANRLELTSGLGNTARAAFLNEKQSVASFNYTFVYQTVSGAGGADGVTFCIQNAGTGAAALGGGGGGLGYSGITPSFALGLNIYDPNTRGVRFLQNGALPAAGAGAFMPATPVLVGGNANPLQVTVGYSGGVLTATLRDLVTPANTFTTNITVDIPAVVGDSSAYVGFTGADGGVVSTQVISNFTAVPPSIRLDFQKVGDSLVFSWPASAGAVLRSSPTLNPAVWSDATAPFQVITNQGVVTVSPLTGNQYYRLDVYP